MSAAAAAFAVVAAILITSPASAVAPGPHIADLNVLLPPRMTKPVGYRLQGSGGCFTWSWDHHDILLVEPEYNDTRRCSSSAWLTSIAPYMGRKETSVYATDRVSGLTIHCKVFVDQISQIRIFHHAVKINLDELATLHIRAFDNEENVFSSLVGLRILWKLEPRSAGAATTNHLVHVPLKETHLSDCSGFCGDLDARIELEDNGFGADMFVVKGIEIGHEIVTAQLFEPNYDSVVDTIVLTVAEAMSLDPPSPVLLTVGALIHFRLRAMRKKSLHAISLPSQYHRWRVTNSSVARVDVELGITQALNLGLTEVVAEDIRVSGHVQTSSLYVVTPHKIILLLLPLVNDTLDYGSVRTSSSEWFLFRGQDYILQVKAFAEAFDDREIYLTEKNRVKMEKSAGHWELLPVPDILIETFGLRHSSLLRPLSEGIGSLVASLTYLRGVLESEEVLELEHEFRVCSRVKLSLDEETKKSGLIHLPWMQGVAQNFELKTAGGCGKGYIYLSSNDGVISVSNSGLVHVKRPGKTIVRVHSAVDFLNYDEVAVEVSIPSALALLPEFPADVPVGTELLVMAKLKTSNGSYFSKCDYCNSFIQWSVLSETRSFELVDLPNESNSKEPSKAVQNLDGNFCSMTVLKASAAGVATVIATLSYGESSYLETSGYASLTAHKKISAYHPLEVFQAGDGNQFGGYCVNQDTQKNALSELPITPGSSMDVVLFGGPDHWDQNAEFSETVNISGDIPDPSLNPVGIQQLSHGVYRVSCSVKGNFKLLFARGNLVDNNRSMATVATVDLLVVCDIPSEITIVANEPVNTFEVLEESRKTGYGPGMLRRLPVVIANRKSIRLSAVGVHKSGRYFANSSSLCLRWDISDCHDLASLDGSKENEVIKKSTWEKFLVLLNSTGLCKVRATVVGFCDANNGALDVKAHEISDSIQLQIVSSLRMEPEHVLLVYHPEAREKLLITGGTCFLDAFSNDTKVIEIMEPPRKKHCSHLIVRVRGLGTSVVTISDVGLSPVTSASSLVTVANVDWIKIVSEEQINIMEGTTKEFTLKAGTKGGSIFGDSQYQYIDIEVHLDDKILEPADVAMGWMLHAPKLLIRAKKLGLTSLYVTAKQHSGQTIASQLIKVEVYKPLQMHPEFIYLAPGSSYMLAVKGGPRIGTAIKYYSLHSESAEVDSTSGKLSAKLVGNSTIRAAIFTHGGSFICEAFGKVEVGVPEAMSIISQSNELCVGCSMSVYPSCSKGDLFSFYEVCQHYKWTITNKEVMDFQSIKSFHYDVDKQPSYEGKHFPWFLRSSNSSSINTVVGRSPGRAEVSVVISCDFLTSEGNHPSVYRASISLNVVPDPPIALGIPMTWILPPFYTTSDLLPQSYREMVSNDLEHTITYSLLELFASRDLKLNGVSITGSSIRTGEKNELVCILANDQATGRAEIASCVRVAEIEQVRIGASEISFHEAYLGVNSRLELDIKYSDRLGYMFIEANGVVPVEVDVNHRDVVSILLPKDESNTTHHEHFIIEGRRPGTALIRISINPNLRKADFILVFVGEQMYPMDPVIHVGHCLNFSIVGNGIGGPRSGHWSCNNKTILSVNGLTGEACAHGEGVVQVIFKGSNLNLQTTVTAVKGAPIVYGSTSALKNIQPELCRTDEDVDSLGPNGEERINGSYGVGERITTVRSTFITWPAILATAGVLVLTILVFTWLLNRPDRSVVPRQAPAVPPPATPDCSPGNRESAPRTPEPFVEYVRRTLDETPYYKREPRKRHDPQYTY